MAWLHIAARHDITVHSLISALGHWPTRPESFWRVPFTNKQFKWIPVSVYMCPGTVSYIFIWYLYSRIYTHRSELKAGSNIPKFRLKQFHHAGILDGNISSGVPLIVLVGSLDLLKSSVFFAMTQTLKRHPCGCSWNVWPGKKKIPNAALKEAPSILSMEPSSRNPSKRFKKQFGIGTTVSILKCTNYYYVYLRTETWNVRARGRTFSAEKREHHMECAYTPSFAIFLKIWVFLIPLTCVFCQPSHGLGHMECLYMECQTFCR